MGRRQEERGREEEKRGGRGISTACVMSELVSPEIKNSQALASNCGQNHIT